eukprot:CAMPEP_0206476578 /NCGR_PEP_ID=MMETSP0324_2-20121206/34814_1 /ASSEMBLY_ACC=CAM_ASM_000836 /TAXON_ID=2866 /ORGANISM="Crypthecodinium cohnii, Strain Seligo" /LENGTH=161 /DNA_ID=CAMNT_0053952265 /DNA_START=65 /DNA_END=551 /DNA_ORIENTATION=-
MAMLLRRFADAGGSRSVLAATRSAGFSSCRSISSSSSSSSSSSAAGKGAAAAAAAAAAFDAEVAVATKPPMLLGRHRCRSRSKAVDLEPNLHSPSLQLSSSTTSAAASSSIAAKKRRLGPASMDPGSSQHEEPAASAMNWPPWKIAVLGEPIPGSGCSTRT